MALPDGRVLVLHASLGEPLEGGERRVGLEWTLTDVPFATVAEAAGYIPIPPYLRRDAEDSDTDDYRTVYSRVEGLGGRADGRAAFHARAAFGTEGQRHTTRAGYAALPGPGLSSP